MLPVNHCRRLKSTLARLPIAGLNQSPGVPRNRRPETASFNFNTLIPERRNDSSVVQISRSTVLRRSIQHGMIQMTFGWLPEGVTIPDAYMAMTECGLEIRRLSEDDALHTYPMLDLLTKYRHVFKPFIHMALEEGIFKQKQLQELGYGCTVNTGVPSTMLPQGPRPPSFHIAQYNPGRCEVGYVEQPIIRLNLNALCGVSTSGGGCTEISNPVFAEKPHHLRFNAVCHVAKNGERSLRLVEWATGEYVKRAYFRKVKVFELTEDKMNSKDPRWVSNLQALGLWPITGSSDKVTREGSDSRPSDLEKIAERHAHRHLISSYLSNTKVGALEPVRDAVIREANVTDLAPSLVTTVVTKALADLRARVKSQMKLETSLDLLAKKVTRGLDLDIRINAKLLARFAIFRSILKQTPGPEFWDAVDQQLTELRSKPRKEVSRIIDQLLDEDRRKHPAPGEHVATDVL